MVEVIIWKWQLYVVYLFVSQSYIMDEFRIFYDQHDILHQTEIFANIDHNVNCWPWCERDIRFLMVVWYTQISYAQMW